MAYLSAVIVKGELRNGASKGFVISPCICQKIGLESYL